MQILPLFKEKYSEPPIGMCRAFYFGKMRSNVHPQSEKLSSGVGRMPVPSGSKVLILSGEARQRVALNASFLRYGWQVKVTSTVREALRVISHQLVDLVISSLELADGGVLEVIAALHVDTPETPVIVLASQASVTKVVQVMRAGAFDVLAGDSCLELLQDAACNAMRGCNGRSADVSRGRFVDELETCAASVMTLSELNRKHLEDALEQTEGNRTHAAKVLGISVRTVRNKIREYGLPPRCHA
jgi:DNA-binding NtrC family response regulator